VSDRPRGAYGFKTPIPPLSSYAATPTTGRAQLHAHTALIPMEGSICLENPQDPICIPSSHLRALNYIDVSHSPTILDR
jgi:hypothetical protein